MPVPPLAIAQWCAGNGWPVHPLTAGRKTPVANCRDCRDRHHEPKSCPCLPAGRPCHGFHAASTDRPRLQAWWSASPRAGVGVSCGPASLVILDIDAHSAPVPDRSLLLPGIPIHQSVDLTGLASGFDTLALLSAFRRQANPAEDETTLRVRTPSGGLHVWYRNLSTSIRFRSSTGSSTKVALAWQVDVRADAGYIIAPGTRTTQGTYEPVGPARLPAPLPAWLADDLARTGHVPVQATPKRRTPPVPRARRPGSQAAAHRVLGPLVTEVAQCGATAEGAGFTEKLNRAAYTAGGLVATGHLDLPFVQALLADTANQARPRQTSRNEKIISDGLAAGTARPLHLKGRS
ncbi:bifunctional DNA primase/polymerase [Streptomyces sp. MS2.AVA.5]|uniref:Bifunctional DNA primase/polymerase n=1 Tax=Streptomyces achmelvichensis TaxID=3134111 RepID=A0ACC6PLV8_9ACTN